METSDDPRSRYNNEQTLIQMVLGLKSLSEQGKDPFHWYQTMRETEPIHYNARYNVWELFRYADVRQIALDYTAFSSEVAGSMTGKRPINTILVQMDPPRHRQLRSLVNQAFTPRTVARLTQHITTITHELLDAAAPYGTLDVVSDLSDPLPVIVIAELLGVPVADHKQLKFWTNAITGLDFQESLQSQAEIEEYFLKVIEQRQAQPKDDLISNLLVASIEGQHISQMELLGFCMSLLIAGNETTTNLIANAVLCFDEHHEVMPLLQANSNLLPGAIEEVLRYRSPLQVMPRIARVDTSIGGQAIKKGDWLLGWIGSANRDETEFPFPEDFNIKRTPNRHLAFGYGIHSCLGAPLARLEAMIALEAMMQHFVMMQCVPGAHLEKIHSDFVYGVRHLPITFQLK
ncbi:MAG: cytochrome P450 [Ktedonobacteraceae bacterium]